MSRESMEWLNQNVLVGFTKERGNAWHYKASLQGTEPNHYEGAIPIEDVKRRLFFWNAVEAPVFVRIEDNTSELGYKYIEQTDRKAVVRNDNWDVLGMFKAGYAIHQYEQWLLGTVADIIDDSDLRIGSAGLLKSGGVAWVSIELPETINTSVGFQVRPHLLATTSHNGSLATSFLTVCTAVVCDNTLTTALNEGGAKHTTRHSKHSGFKLQSVRDALGIVHTLADDVVGEIERLSAVTVTNTQWDEIVNRIVPINTTIDVRPQAVSRAKNKQEEIRSLYLHDPRVAPWTGTALGVLNAFNTYQHHSVGKDDTRVERNALNALTGKASEFDQYVLNVLNDVVFA
jgi:phage/plasmid-like protein (TIGR03299 family)